MPSSITADQLVAAFKRWGVPHRERSVNGVSWRNHHRPGSYGPIHGIVLHHTGDDAPDTADFNVLWHGNIYVPGPLSTWGTDDEGVVHLIGHGRSNHAGRGSSATLAAVRAESYGNYPPTGPDDIDGNTFYLGDETMYSGRQQMTPKAYASTVKAFAAVCEFFKWNAKHAIGHKEHTKRKIDPGSLDMAVFRRDLQAALNRGPTATPVEEIINMELTDRVTLTDGDRKLWGTTSEYFTVAQILRSYNARLFEVRALLTQIRDQGA